MGNALTTTLAVVLVFGARPAMSQEQRSFSERFSYGGEISGTISPEDPGFFNELEYERNLLRLIRFNFALEFRASDRLTFLTEIRSDNLDVPDPYALYVRIRPWRARAFDIQVGRIPPVFGQFARRRYDIDNPLIGTPLTYQYPNTTRPDAAPSELAQVLAQRGYGVRVLYPIGDRAPMAGLPMVNPLRWDTGVQVKLGSDPIELGVAVTQGTISNPRVRDDNSGKQIAARLGLRPAFGWVLGVSGARGEYVADDVTSIADDTGYQTAVGLDLEFSRNHFILRAETIWSQWDAPTLETGALGGLGFYVEASYKISPGFYVAARIDRVSFGEVDSAEGAVTWDSTISRVEIGVGYYFHRQLLAKASYQYNERDAGPLTTRGIPSLRLLFWF